MEKQALVTGATGFLGSYLVEFLCKAGWHVIGTDVRPPAKPNSSQFYFQSADLASDYDFLKLFSWNYTLIFHCAVSDLRASQEELRKVNVEGTRRVCALALETGCRRLIVFSSASFYDRRYLDFYGGSEETPLAPRGNYQRSAQAREEVALRFSSRYALPLTMIRLAPLYGPGRGSRLGTFLLRISRLPFLLLLPWLEYKVRFVHVEDACRAALFLAGKSEACGEIFNVADDTNLSLRELRSYLSEKREVKSLPLPRDFSFLSPAFLSALFDHAYAEEWLPVLPGKSHPLYSNKKIKKLGFTFLYEDVRKGVENVLSWYWEKGGIA